ncbi:phosphate-starvation-inducible PsiE family protein [Dictyobacter kobayashii]|uniref:Phosphate-starvation-inducible E-like protein n=1 Tax=Dictyobacter kobayashii TaxID=2014872 RepID=A0A402ANE4_9CHLR|nr:phosphate-starvation-inducible PsiE family protein [Dictyobacter kobayashii]GCE20636.1 hypothetical protein KDK_44360 [Dictyobacter kobayashii]
MDEKDTRNASQEPFEIVPEEKDLFAGYPGKVLDRIDTIIYIIVGGSFILAAILALIYSYFDLEITLTSAIRSASLPAAAQSVIGFVSGLLLVLIIMEVLSTVIHYLRSHTTSLQPFLFIGIISATRSILSIGARLSIEGASQQGAVFIDAMIELGVSALVVLALGITLMLIGKMAEVNTHEEH